MICFYYALFPMRVGNGKFFAAPYRRLHWATIVSHFVRWPHTLPSVTFPLGEQSVLLFPVSEQLKQRNR